MMRFCPKKERAVLVCWYCAMTSESTIESDDPYFLRVAAVAAVADVVNTPPVENDGRDTYCDS